MFIFAVGEKHQQRRKNIRKMYNESFVYKSYCELIITSKIFDPAEISYELGMQPIRSFKKGEQTVSKHSGSIITKPYNLWAVKSKSSELVEETITHHVNYFQSLFLSKMNSLVKYKEDNRLEVTFWIWVETDNSGIGLNLDEGEQAFLNRISNHLRISVICKNE